MKARQLISVIVLGLFVLVGTAGTAICDEKAEGKTLQQFCPVMGGKIDKKVHTDHQGQKVYFRYAGCIEKFTADPAKYMKKLKEQLAKLKEKKKHDHDHGHDHHHH